MGLGWDWGVGTVVSSFSFVFIALVVAQAMGRSHSLFPRPLSFPFHLRVIPRPRALPPSLPPSLFLFGLVLMLTPSPSHSQASKNSGAPSPPRPVISRTPGPSLPCRRTSSRRPNTERAKAIMPRRRLPQRMRSTRRRDPMARGLVMRLGPD